MSDTSEQKQTRREMFRSSLRYLALGGVGLLWGGLYVRSSHNSAANRCPQSYSCGGCPSFDQCTLPQAEKSRISLQNNRAPLAACQPVHGETDSPSSARADKPGTMRSMVVAP